MPFLQWRNRNNWFVGFDISRVGRHDKILYSTNARKEYTKYKFRNKLLFPSNFKTLKLCSRTPCVQLYNNTLQAAFAVDNVIGPYKDEWCETKLNENWANVCTEVVLVRSRCHCHCPGVAAVSPNRTKIFTYFDVNNDFGETSWRDIEHIIVYIVECGRYDYSIFVFYIYVYMLCTSWRQYIWTVAAAIASY